MTAPEARALRVDDPVQTTRWQNEKNVTYYGKVQFIGRRYFIVVWRTGDFTESVYWHPTGPNYAHLERADPT